MSTSETDTHSNSDLEKLAGPEGDGKATVRAKLEYEIQSHYLEGWRLYATTTALCTALFLATLEISIVSTSLISISSSLRIFKDSTWIITAYLLTYTGFLIIWAQFSDVLGRKLSACTAIGAFVVFSGACGAAQTSGQLIGLRAMQGVGGGGMYSMAMVIMSEAVPVPKFPKYTSIISAVFSLAYLVGPLMGGGINNHTTWRWVFLLNVPVGVPLLVVTMLSIPNRFPHQNKPSMSTELRSRLRRLDPVGALLFLGMSVLFATALQQAGSASSWKSATVITCLVVSLACLVAFLGWERLMAQSKDRVAVLPWRFLRNRRIVGLFLSAFLMGAPMTSSVIQIPVRLQSVDDASPLSAGIRLLPFIVTVPLVCAFAAVIVARLRIQPTYALIAGSVLQLVGTALFSTLGPSHDVAQYGYQVILGIGLGISNAVSATAVPSVAPLKDIGAATGANTQFRILGGVVGLAIVTCTFNSKLKPEMASVLSQSQLTAVLQSATEINSLPQELQDRVREAFSAAFSLQWKALLGLIAAQIPAALMMWNRLSAAATT